MESEQIIPSVLTFCGAALALVLTTLTAQYKAAKFINGLWRKANAVSGCAKWFPIIDWGVAYGIGILAVVVSLLIANCIRAAILVAVGPSVTEGGPFQGLGFYLGMLGDGLVCAYRLIFLGWVASFILDSVRFKCWNRSVWLYLTKLLYVARSIVCRIVCGGCLCCLGPPKTR